MSLPPPLAALLDAQDAPAIHAWLDAHALPPRDAGYVRALAFALAGEFARALELARATLARAIGDEPLLELIAGLEQLLAAAPAPAPAAAAAATGWSIGSVVADRWEVFGAARGGMGEVFFVRDREWGGKQLAVKSLLLAEPAAVGALAALFRREARVWLDLGGHPNIVSGYYTLELDAALRFFMEFVPGRSLAAILADARGAPLPLPRALDLAIQMVVGLGYVHARGVVHRDLKPDNCLIDPADALRLTDFGLGKSAVAVDRPAAATAASPIAVASAHSVTGAGTPMYMAPEQWRSLAAASFPADVYAFGIVLHELFTGARPFDEVRWPRYRDRLPPHLAGFADGNGHPVAALRAFHEHAEPPTLRELGADVPPAIDAIAAGCLVKDPARRPAFAEIQEALLAAHARALGPYARELHVGFGSTVAGDNNRAVSYSVMGDVAAARRLLAEVRAREPAAVAPAINDTVLAVNLGEANPAAVAGELGAALDRTSPHDPIAARLTTLLARHALRHRGEVAALALADGIAATGSTRGDVFVWDVATGELAGKHDVPAGVAAIAIRRAANGTRTIVAAGRDGSLHVVGKPGAPLPPPGGRITGLSCADDGTLVAIVDGERAVSAAPGATRWEVVRERIAGGASTLAGRIVTDGSGLAIHDLAGARVFHHAMARQLDATDVLGGLLPEAGGEEVTAVGWLGDDRVAVATVKRSVFDFDRPKAMVEVFARAGARTASLAMPRPVVALAGDGLLLAIGRDDGAVLAVGEDGAAVLLGTHAGRVTHVAVAGEVVISTGIDGTARRWPVRGAPPPDPPWPLVIEQTLSAHERETVDARIDRLIAALAGPAGEPRRAAARELAELRGTVADYARDPALVARIAGALAGSVPRAGLAAHWLGRVDQIGADITCGAIGGTATAPRVVVGTQAGALVELGARTRRPHRGAVGSLAFAGDDLVIASAAGVERRAADDSVAQQWGGVFGRPTLAAVGPGGEVVVAKAKAGATAIGRTAVALVTAHDDGTVRWQVDGAAAIATRAHAGRCAAIAVGGDRAATAGNDREIAVWTARGELVRRLTGSRGWIAALAISADGAWLASGGGDKLVRIWDLRSGACLAELAGHARTIRAVGFTADDLACIAIDEAGALRLWYLDARWEVT